MNDVSSTTSSSLGVNLRSSSMITASSRVFTEASNRRAKVITFYRNGHQFEHGLRVSFVPGKTFLTMDHLMDHLTRKAPDISFGVRYIFTMDGKMIASLDNLIHGRSYVISGVKQFHPLKYGYNERTVDRTIDRTPVDYASSVNGSYNREDVSSQATYNVPLRHSYNDLHSTRVEEQKRQQASSNAQLNQLNDLKVVTLISKQDSSVKSKVILNLRTPKSFESVLKDLAEAVNIDRPSKLLTQSGTEVRVEQLLRMIN